MFQLHTNIYRALPQPTVVVHVIIKGVCCVCKMQHAKMQDLI